MVDSMLSFVGVYTTLMQHTFQSLGGSSVNGFLCHFIEMQALDGVSFEFLSDGPVVCRPTHTAFYPNTEKLWPHLKFMVQKMDMFMANCTNVRMVLLNLSFIILH